MRKWQIVAAVVLLLLVGVIVTVVVLATGSASGACVVQSDVHTCLCPGDPNPNPILISGDSIQLLDKIFSASEITRLKEVNTNATKSMYSVFQEIDSSTM